MPLVYEELRRLARRYMRVERSSHTLQTTALVNVAYLRLIDVQDVQWQSRAHFFAIAAQVMRRILVDHARTRRESSGEEARHNSPLRTRLFLVRKRLRTLSLWTRL
jgi:RNA polymerase sigma-70 factor (ECF subfamily)